MVFTGLKADHQHICCHPSEECRDTSVEGNHGFGKEEINDELQAFF
jgi:hypothetical protein